MNVGLTNSVDYSSAMTNFINTHDKALGNTRTLFLKNYVYDSEASDY